VPASDAARVITLDFARVQPLASPDTREAAILMREIVIRSDATSDRPEAIEARKGVWPNNGEQVSGSDERLADRQPSEQISRSTGAAGAINPDARSSGQAAPPSEHQSEIGASEHAGAIMAWRANLIDETASWANRRRPTPRVCNVCGFFGYFQPHWYPVGPEVKCPQCSSLDRHRLLKLWFDEHIALFEGASILHFAPESSVTRFVKPGSREYTTADLSPRGGDIRINIEAIDLPDAQFDVVICSHVLEHVDDRRALRELHRIVKPSGIVLLMFPIVEGWDRTYEDSSRCTEEERWQHFGQGDHVRLYGSDVRQRIVDAGFSLSEFTATQPNVIRHGLKPGEKLFVATKPASVSTP